MGTNVQPVDVATGRCAVHGTAIAYRSSLRLTRRAPDPADPFSSKDPTVSFPCIGWLMPLALFLLAAGWVRFRRIRVRYNPIG